MNITSFDSVKGLYHKFFVTRTDGRSGPGGLHENCKYFVLDLTHDKHAIPAIQAYAKSCRKKNPVLADDLQAVVKELK